MSQLDLFDMLYETYHLPSERPIRIIETFAGIGTQRMAFEKLGVPYEIIAIVEVDKEAVKAYAAAHTDYLIIRDTYFIKNDIKKRDMVRILQAKNLGINFKNGKQTITDATNIERVRDYYLADLLSNNYGDISKVKGEDLPNNIDMLTYSFPCTDLSKAGLQAGLGKNTRSGLVYEVFRITEELIAVDNAPQTLVMENVIDLVQRKFIKEFQGMQLELEALGYMNYVVRMNARDYGVAQNRDRVFMNSIRGKWNYRSPKPRILDKRLADYLEKEVDEKYFLSEKFTKSMMTNSSDKYDRKLRFETSTKSVDEWTYSTAITTREGCVATSTFIKVPEKTKKGYSEAYEGDGIYLDRPHQKRGCVQNGMIQTLKTSGNDIGVVVKDTLASKKDLCNRMLEKGHLKPTDMINHSYTSKRLDNLGRTESTDGVSATLTTRPDTLGVVVDEMNNGLETELHKHLRIRKLTPLECWRLMGIEDKYFYRAQQVTSNSQLYKQAGNAIVVDVFAELIKPMIKTRYI